MAPVRGGRGEAILSFSRSSFALEKKLEILYLSPLPSSTCRNYSMQAEEGKRSVLDLR